MKHVAIYVRVSSRQQDTASQLPDLERWVKAQEGEVRWYTDKASGKTMDRKAWNRLEDDVRVGHVSSVVVWRLDRLGRTAKGLTALFDELYRRKVNLVSLKDGIDLNTSAGRLMANVLASVAQYETEVRGERVMAGQSVAQARGKKWGGSQRGRVTKQTLAPERIEQMRKLKSEGEQVAAIARATGVSRQTVYKHLQIVQFPSLDS